MPEVGIVCADAKVADIEGVEEVLRKSSRAVRVLRAL